MTSFVARQPLMTQKRIRKCKFRVTRERSVKHFTNRAVDFDQTTTDRFQLIVFHGHLFCLLHYYEPDTAVVNEAMEIFLLYFTTLFLNFLQAFSDFDFDFKQR